MIAEKVVQCKNFQIILQQQSTSGGRTKPMILSAHFPV